MKLFHRGIVILLLVVVFVVFYFAVYPYYFVNKSFGEKYSQHKNGVSFTTEKPEVIDIHKLNEEWENFLSLKSQLEKKKDIDVVRKNRLNKSRVQKQGKTTNVPNVKFIIKNTLTSKLVETTKTLITDSVSKAPAVGRDNENQPVKEEVSSIVNHVRQESQSKSTFENEKLNSKSSKKWLILIYTHLHKFEEWPNLPKSKTKGYFKNILCKARNCRVTYDKSLFKSSDAVIFHERNMPGPDMLDTLNSWRTVQQRWIFFTSETPKNSDTNIVPYNGLFNWTMTYKKDSDIYLPYLQYRVLDENDSRPPANYDYSKLKTMSTAWLVGNCKFFFRMEYVRLLQEYTDIHVGGGCRDKFKSWINCTRWCPIENLKTYKFYLSFENGICTDYISEKYWKYLELGLVPVVLGGSDYNDPRLVIPGSFIDASKFSSAKELGLYLNYLDKNDTAYNEYFSWKQKYKIWHPTEGDWPFESYFLCKICEMLNADLPKKTYWSLSEFWNEYTDCEVPEENLKKSMFPENFDWEYPNKREDEKELIKKSIIRKNFDEE